MVKHSPVLAEFEKSIKALAQLLNRDPDLDDEDRVSIENHLQIVQMAYTVWTHRKASRSRNPHG